MITNGTYGTKKPAFITSDDVDIFYFYRPTRSTDSMEFSTGFQMLDSSLLMSTTYVDDDDNVSNLPGMYNLKLPVDKFGSPGIYTIYIKPKEIEATISDIGVLTAYPNIRGVVLNSSNINATNSQIFNNGGLIGYRIDYYDNDVNGQLTQQDMYRIITSNNRCEPVSQNFNDVNGKGIKYRLNNSSNLIFCTVTPSIGMSFNPNDLPSLGTTGQKIKLVNTKFNPISLEIEMVERDVQDIATMLEGDQIRNLDNAIITTFNKDGEIYHQAEYGNIVDTATGTHTDFKFAKDRTNFDASEKQKMDEIKEQI
jgi:hypothetical protein